MFYCITVKYIRLGTNKTKMQYTGTENCDINLQVNYVFVYVLYTLIASNM